MSTYDHELGAARATLCRLLAACYYQPGPEFAEEKVFANMLAGARRISPELAAVAARLGEAFAALDLEALLIDYTQLFLGPVNAPAKPYGSVYLTGEASLMQGSTMEVLDLYRQGGFDLADDFQNLPDHIAAELEFLYLTIHRENEAQWNADLDAVAKAMDLRRRLLNQHLSKWIEPFTIAILRSAGTDYYRELATLTRKFVALQTAAVQ